jgi:hypothetical protein
VATPPTSYPGNPHVTGARGLTTSVMFDQTKSPAISAHNLRTPLMFPNAYEAKI